MSRIAHKRICTGSKPAFLRRVVIEVYSFHFGVVRHKRQEGAERLGKLFSDISDDGDPFTIGELNSSS